MRRWSRPVRSWCSRIAQVGHASGFLAVYLAGMIVGNRPTRAHNTVIVFLDAATWLAQIVMFVLLGLLAWPERLLEHALPALAVAVTLMFFARPLAVFLCLTPFRFSWREKAFVSWVGLRGAVGIFLASIPLLVGLPNALRVLRHRFRRRAGLAPGAGMDHRDRGAEAPHRAAAQRSGAAPRRARSARPARAGARRLLRSGPTIPICAAVCRRHGRS